MLIYIHTYILYGPMEAYGISVLWTFVYVL